MTNEPSKRLLKSAKAIFGYLFLFLAIFLYQVPAQKRATAGRATKIKSAARPAEAKPATFGLTFEKYENDYYLNSDGTGMQTLEIVQKCENEPCLDQLKKYTRDFNGDLEQAKVLEAYILRQDGTKTQLPPEAIQIRMSPQAEAAPGFSSFRQIDIAFDGVTVGDSTVVKTQTQTLKPIFENQFSGMKSFPVIFGWKSVRISVSAPADLPIYADSAGLQSEKSTGPDGRVIWTWSARDIKPIVLEPAISDVTGMSPRLVFSTLKNYEQLALLFREAVLKQGAVTPEVQKLADQITAGISDPREQAAAIFTWVNKNIRYLQVYSDRDGWIPHSTGQILSTRYGDCKDYTTLIFSLLRAKDIESIPSLVRAGAGDWFPNVASMYYFNHAVLYIPSLDAIADATAPNTKLGMLSQLLAGKKVLLADERPRIYEAPKDDPQADVATSEIDVTFGEDGSIKAISRDIQSGRREMGSRTTLSGSEAKDPDFIKIMFATTGLDASGRVLKTSDPGKLDEPFSFELESRIPNFTSFQKKGRVALPVGINLQNMLAGRAFLLPETRQTTLLLGAARTRETYRLHFPPSVKIGTLPADVKTENSVGRFTMSFTRTQDGVEVTRELVTLRDSIEPKDYQFARELFSKAFAAQSHGIEYTSTLRSATSGNSLARAKQASADDSDIYTRLVKGVSEDAPLTAAAAGRLERSLINAPDDLEVHLRLIHYYDRSGNSDADKKDLFGHKLWFVQKHPEMSAREIYGWDVDEKEKNASEYQTLRDEWLRQVAARGSDPDVRLNAADFIGANDRELSLRLLEEGRSLFPANYEFPLRIAVRLGDDLARLAPTQKKAAGGRALSAGEESLALIKTERSGERDKDRFALLKRLCSIANEMEEVSKAKAFATELVLDFGPSATNPGRASAVHIGNITLGRAELQSGNIDKAAEYLLISIRGSLRIPLDDIARIDTTLASELFARGAKQAVTEYLKLSLERKNFKRYPDLRAKQVATISSWIAEIEKGESPSFDLDRAGQVGQR